MTVAKKSLISIIIAHLKDKTHAQLWPILFILFK